MDEAHALICRLRHARGAARLPAGALLHALQRDRLYRAERTRVLAGLRGISSASCLGGTLLEQFAEHRFHALEIEGLLQEDRVFEALRCTQVAPARGESERHAPLLKRIGHQITILAAEIDIEDRRLQLAACDELKPVLHRAGRPNDLTAELLQPTLDHH